MIYVRLDYSDGRYRAIQLKNEQEAKSWKEHGTPVQTLEDSMWAAFQAHNSMDAVFQGLMLAWDNEQSVERSKPRESAIQDAALLVVEAMIEAGEDPRAADSLRDRVLDLNTEYPVSTCKKCGLKTGVPERHELYCHEDEEDEA